VIVGVDVNYNHTSLSAVGPSFPIQRVLSAGGLTYDVTIAGNASMNIKDLATARLRGGFVLDNFLPFATFGFAVGRADIVRSATITGTEDGVPFSFSDRDVKNDAFIYGLSFGLGMDFLLTPCWFVRAEYEYVRFFDISGVKPQLQTGRLGAAYKF
jgi:opacity protein-like surface antigen